MLKNFFINAIRNMQKHSGYLILNITGLTIGLTSFLLITIYVLHELSYDRFHKNYENIYRIKVKGLMAGATDTADSYYKLYKSGYGKIGRQSKGGWNQKGLRIR
jgi:hypothetical protein